MARFQQQRHGTPLRWVDPLTQGLKLYLPMNEGGGRVVNNAASGSPGGNDFAPPSNGRFTGTPTWGVGPVGGAIVMPGSGNNYISVNPLPWPAGRPASVSAWVLISGGQNPPLFGSGTTVAANVFRLYPSYSDNKCYWEYGGTSGNGALNFNFPTALYGKWFHIAAVSQGVGGAYRAIYINGTLAASGNASASPGAATTFFTIGAYDLGRWAGSVSQFAIWDRALGQTEIARLYSDPHCLLQSFPLSIRQYQAPGAISGTSAVTAPAATLTASGTIVNAYTGTSAVTAAAATMAASGAVVNPAAGFGSNFQLLGIG